MPQLIIGILHRQAFAEAFGSDLDGGRVAQPFSFALTDPYVRLSRIRLFPKVTPRPASRRAGMSDPRSRQGEAIEHSEKGIPAHPTLAAAPERPEPDAPDPLVEPSQRAEVAG